jgi:hypothetical protein
MPITWTAAKRKKLHGFRRPHKSDPKDMAPGLTEAWGLLRTRFGNTVAGAPHHVALAQVAMDELKEPAPPTQLDPVRELYRWSIVASTLSDRVWERWEGWLLPRALIALWWEIGGPRFAVDVLLQKPRFAGHQAHFNDYEPRLVFVCTGCGRYLLSDTETCCGALLPREVENEGPMQLTRHYEPMWWALRARLSAVDEKTFAAARRSVDDLFQKPGEVRPLQRAWLTYAFNRDLELSRSEIDRALRLVESDVTFRLSPDGNGRPSFVGIEQLTVSAPDAKTAVELSTRFWCRPYRNLAFDLVENIEEDAGPIISARLAEALKTSRKQYHTPMIEALKLLE